MKKKALSALILSLCCFVLYFQAGLRVGANQAVQSPGPVIKVSVTVVQVDAVVTDKQGRHVSDLKPEDFTILENGRPQKITNFAYITVPKPTARFQMPPLKHNQKELSLTPPTRLKPEELRRIITFVVDDLNLPFDDISFVRDSLRKFIETKMQPGDIVSIFTIRSGRGSLEQYTTDRRQLLLAVDGIRWDPFGNVYRAGVVDDYAAIGQRDFRMDLHEKAMATVAALNFVVRRVDQAFRGIPGRKSIIFFANGIGAPNQSVDELSDPSLSWDPIERMVETANRASVAIYPIEPRGPDMANVGVPASDPMSGTSQFPRTLGTERLSTMGILGQQVSLGYLAEETGGMARVNNADIVGGISQALDDQSGYYLIGYTPDDQPADHRKKGDQQHKITLKMNRPDLQVRSRKAFYSPAEEGPDKWNPSMLGKMLSASDALFASGDVGLRLTTSFFNDERLGSMLRTILHIDAQDLTFTSSPEGHYQTVLDLLAVTYDEKGPAEHPIGESYTIRFGPQEYQQILRDGLNYRVSLPVRKTGAYQLRVALRDEGSGRIGSASQFVVVPDLKKKGIALSGIALWGSDGTVSPKSDSGKMDSKLNPSVRKLRQGMYLNFVSQAYNVKVDKKTKKPQLETEFRVFRNGRELFVKAEPYDAGSQSDRTRPLVSGRFLISSEMPPGDYDLVLRVIDKLEKEKRSLAYQWADFEVER